MAGLTWPALDAVYGRPYGALSPVESDAPQSCEATQSPVLDIPLEHETWPSYRERLKLLLADPATHAYIDTSFLMWLTKIGATSRNELLLWFQRHLADRVHVPIWTAHEYLKHHVRQTIVEDFKRNRRAARNLATKTYANLRPFIDEHPTRSATHSSTLRLAIRETLNRLAQLVDEANEWPQSYGRHSADVLKFVNEAAPTNTSVFSDLATVADHGELRLTSTIPPGFNDLHKRHHGSTSSGQQPPGDTNEFGDLMFWQELLSHAREIGSGNIIVISNDSKNDWRFGGPGNTADTDPELLKIRDSWKPVPRPHPILVVEARLKANIKRLDLLDSIYLGLYLKHTGAPDVANFIDVALIPERYDDDTAPSEQHAASDDHPPADTSQQTSSPTPSPLFADADRVSATQPKLTRALFLSRGPSAAAVDDNIQRLMSDWTETAPNRTDPEQLIHGTTILGSLSHQGLTVLARALHDRARANEPGYPDTLADVLSILPRMPPNTAASFYLGFLASTYLDPQTNQSLIPPSSPVTQRLFEFQTRAFAVIPTAVLSQRLLDNESQPVYIPTSAPSEVHITLQSDPTGPVPRRIGGIYVQHNHAPALILNLLTPVQPTASLRLASLFQSQPVSGTDLVDTACELFALPRAQVAPDPSIEREHLFSETAGFKNPAALSIVKDL